MPTYVESSTDNQPDTRQPAERLAFIVQCRALDMTLDEVRVLLHLKDAPRADCAEVNALVDEHIGHVAP